MEIGDWLHAGYKLYFSFAAFLANTNTQLE